MATHPTYRADIDGIRAVAVLAVVAYHAFPRLLPGGFVGVDVFFVISGYLINTIILQGCAEGSFSYRDFYRRRIRRIFPALIVVLISALVAGWFLLRAADYQALGHTAAGGAAFVANFIFWHDAGYFDADSGVKPLLHLWSLAVEEQFYIACPVLVWLIWRHARRYFLPIIGTIGLASLAFSLWILPIDATADFYSPLTRVWELAVGCILAFLMLQRPNHPGRGKDWAGFAGLALIAVAAIFFNKAQPFPGWRALLPTLGTFLLISAGPGAWVNRRVLSSRVAVGVGLISYPLYLWHWPLLAFGRILRDYGDIGGLGTGARAGLVALSFGLAWLVFRFVERPIRRGDMSAVAIFVVMLGVFAAALAVDANDGLPKRAINTSPKSLFMQYYRELHDHGSNSAYRAECDFYDWITQTPHSSVPADCTAPGERGTWLLWGDSHAQALSNGLRAILPPGYALAQVATSGCHPSLKPSDGVPDWNGCKANNALARQRISALHPDTLILAQQWDHELTDWDAIAAFAHAQGVRRVVLVGPVPEWQPTLPQIMASHYLDSPTIYVKIGLLDRIFTTDRALHARYAHDTNLVFVSLVDRLCTAEGCRARVPVPGPFNLMAMDYGHLTPDASIYIAREILAGVLQGP